MPKINADTKLGFSLMGLNYMFLPSLLDPTSRLNILTCIGYMFLLFLALASYRENKQKIATFAQQIGIVFWFLMLVKSI